MRALTSIGRLVVLLALAGALLAGCGGDSEKDKFAKAFKPVNDELITLGGNVGQAVGSARNKPDLVLAGQFEGFAGRLQGIKSQIDKLDPPSDLRAQVTSLSAGVSRLIADLRGIGTAARAHDAKAARAATQSLVRDSASAGDARRALARKTGAKVGP